MVYRSYVVGNHLVGIRTNSKLADEWLADTFAAYEVTDEESDPYYSIYIGEAKGFGRPYHILYREATDLIRTFDPAEVARKLVAELDLLTLKNHRDAPVLEAYVVSRNGVNALVPAAVIPYIRLAGRKVERALTLAVGPTVGVEEGSGRLFPIPPQLDIPASAVDDLARLVGANGDQPASRSEVPDSVDVVCMFHYDPTFPPMMRLTGALAAHALAGQAVNLQAIGGRSLEPLAKLVEGARCYLLQEAKAQQAFELLTNAMDGDESQLAAAGPG